MRREALQGSSEEYQKILQVVQYYALDRAGRCGFSLSKRVGRFDVQTDAQMDHVGVIRSIFGDDIASAALRFDIPSRKELGLEAGSFGLATRSTFHGLKSATVIIFLNGRLIEHAALKRALLQAFAPHLPTSPPAQPFIYLSLRLMGNRVDVNVHPNKRQVFFLDEQEIIAEVVAAMDAQVLQEQYHTQPMQPIIIKKPREPLNLSNPSSSQSASQSSKLYPSQRVLTDSQNTRIDSFLFHSSSQEEPKWSPLLATKRTKTEERVIQKISERPMTSKKDDTIKPKVDFIKSPLNPIVVESSFEKIVKPQEPETIETIAKFEKENLIPIEDNDHPKDPPRSLPRSLLQNSNSQIASLLRQSIVVGVVDSTWSLLQSGTNLLLADHGRLLHDAFQSFLLLGDFHSNETLKVECPLESTSKDILQSKKSWLHSVFKIRFDDALSSLQELPQLIPSQRCPPQPLLSTFLARLCILLSGTKNEDEELKIAVASELSTLYSLLPTDHWQSDWPDYLQHCLLPSLRDSRVHFFTQDTQEYPLQIITNTETLYRSFERC